MCSPRMPVLFVLVVLTLFVFELYLKHKYLLLVFLSNVVPLQAIGELHELDVSHIQEEGK